MATQDTTQLKQNIISIIQNKGPSLPIHIAKGTGLSMLFASAFLSELLSEKRIKISHLRVGSSPIYYLSGQEPQLERYSNNLKSKEKDAFILLKEKKILNDSEQLPAIRVALRAIKDFAIPFQNKEEIFWRYLTAPILELKEEKEEIIPQTKLVINENESQKEQEIIEKEPQHLEKTKEKNPEKSEIKIKEKPIKKRPQKNSTPKKRNQANKPNEKFFDVIKEYLLKKQIEITGIEGFSKDDLILKVKKENAEFLLIAYSKKRIGEEEITKAYKKSQELNLNFTILSKGEPTKKLINFIEAIKHLENIEKIE
ncbi:MAG TPA: hypothetical protein VJB35_04395 [Candidatus Nanoarchaeia archaeon]|nr:hypothetical protein [Candidatus Nanoarchaeia archaeon]